jgi:hypothetical protein
MGEGGAESPLSRSAEEGVGGEGLQGVNIKLSFVGANPHPRLEPFSRLDTHVSYLIGADPAAWHTDVAAWGGVRYVDLYPGIHLEIGAGRDVAPLRLVARPDADLDQVRLRIDGANALAVTDDAIRLDTAIGPLRLPLLQLAPDASDRPASLNANVITAPFSATPPSDVAQEDAPSTLIYSRLIGGINYECSFFSCNIAIDPTGAAYITGSTLSDDFPTTPGSFQPTCAVPPNCIGDAFVTKLDPNGSAAYVYSTYFGGTVDDLSMGIALDSSGAVTIAGWTNSPDLPITSGAYQSTCRSCPDTPDAFVAKLNPTGSALLYSTYVGGTSDDYASSVALDASGAAYIMGATNSGDFPIMPGAVQPTFGGGDYDTFVAKLNLAGSALDYSTFLGGNDRECYPASCDIAVDTSGMAIIAGHTRAANFPTTAGAFQTAYNGGACGFPPNTYPCPDGFVTKLNANGSAFVWSTFLGSNSEDKIHSLTLGADNSIYITGYTMSSGFPTTPGAYDPNCGCDPVNFIGDGFVTHLNAAGSALIASTFVGGSSDDYGYGIAVGGDGSMYMTGYTYSADYPVTPGAFQMMCNGCPGYDAVVTRLEAAATDPLLYSTFLGGTVDDYGNNIVVDGTGAAYITGQSWSLDFPITPREAQPPLVERAVCHCPDAFVTKLNMGAPLTPTPTPPPSTPSPTPTATSTPPSLPYRVYLPLILRIP